MEFKNPCSKHWLIITYTIAVFFQTHKIPFNWRIEVIQIFSKYIAIVYLYSVKFDRDVIYFLTSLNSLFRTMPSLFTFLKSWICRENRPPPLQFLLLKSLIGGRFRKASPHLSSSWLQCGKVWLKRPGDFHDSHIRLLHIKSMNRSLGNDGQAAGMIRNAIIKNACGLWYRLLWVDFWWKKDQVLLFRVPQHSKNDICKLWFLKNVTNTAFWTLVLFSRVTWVKNRLRDFIIKSHNLFISFDIKFVLALTTM